MDKTATRDTPNVNGTPDSDATLWHSIDWAVQEDHVRRLGQRIYKAQKEGNLKQVRNLQKLMLRSHANLLLGVKRVTQLSHGKKTAGIDGERALTPMERGRLVRQLTAKPNLKVKPVKRVFIPKANGKTRPLGIPVIRDRIHQAIVKNALEPEWEAKFEARSYGFRPGRGCQDAIKAIHTIVSQKRATRQWVLDADLSAAFDRIDHEFLLDTLGSFPGKMHIQKWLKAGAMEDGRFHATAEGTPQGGVISPLLLNVALCGMDAAVGANVGMGTKRYVKQRVPAMVRYADDFVGFCTTREEAEQLKARLSEWLAPRGLFINEEKTRIVHLNDGFDFLGFTVRRYRNRKLIIRPSRDAVMRLRGRIREIIREMRGATAEKLIARLNPLLKGWSIYYRAVVSSRVFKGVDAYVYTALWRWAVARHRNKSGWWVSRRYWGQHKAGRRDQWVFGENGSHLYKLAWTRIVRHQEVRGSASKYDPDLADYWAHRSKKRRMPGLENRRIISLAARQKGLCPGCGQDLVEGAGYDPEDVKDWVKWFTASSRALHVHHVIFRRHGGSDDPRNLELRHAECHRELHARGKP